MKSNSDHLPPVIVLGGGMNALSIARSLGRRGVRVYALNEPTSHVRYSRYCRYIRVRNAGTQQESWTRFLLGRESDYLRGAVLLTGSDTGLEIIIAHRDELAQKFILDESNPEAQLCMLNKLCTYQKAVAAGVLTPRFWVAQTREEVMELRPELVYPLIVKPLLSHVFEDRFGVKFTVVADFEQLLEAHAVADEVGIATMLVEHIPGADDRLCSYYTYMDEQGNALFDFTKRVIRRYPIGMGSGSYHITDWNPEVRDESLKLFRHVKLRGLANAEFKRDDRDGKLKLMECNARFTAANCLVADSGYDLALFVYNRLTGRPQRPLGQYRQGLRLWDPVRDYHAYRALRRQGQLSAGQWVRSVLHRQTVPHFRWDDPLPALLVSLHETKGIVSRRAGRKLKAARARKEAMPHAP